MLLIIISNGDELLRNVNIDDLEPSKKEVLVHFLAILGYDTHFKSKLCQNGWRQIKTTCVHERQFYNSSSDPLGSKRPVHVGVKEGYHSKKWLFICCWLV